MMFAERRKGFTLIEMLIVLIIIAVLALVVLPRIMNARRRAKDDATREILVQLNKAVEYFEADVGCYPTGLEVLASNPRDNYPGKQVVAGEVGDVTVADAGSLWRGPYLRGAVLPTVPADADASWSVLTDSTMTLGMVRITGTSRKALDGSYYSDW